MDINIIKFIMHIISLKRLMAKTSQSVRVSSHALLFVNYACTNFAEQRALIHGPGGTSVPRE